MPSQFNLDHARIVLCSWENPWAKSGGLFAVVNKYADFLARSSTDPILIFTPRHSRLGSPPDSPKTQASVDFAGHPHRISIQRLPSQDSNARMEKTRVEWVTIAADGFFQADGGRGKSNPYIYSDDETNPDSSRLLRDSLFFCAAVPCVLQTLGIDQDALIHLNDRQTASVALTVSDATRSGKLTSVRTVLTMHNPYDQGLSRTTWSWITDREFPADRHQTVYRRMLPLLDATPVTVSRQFAGDLLSDPLQTKYFAGHLQPVFAAHGITGVDNGPFDAVRCPFETDDVLAEKHDRRQRMLTLLEAYRRTEPAINGHIAGSDNSDDPRSLAPHIPFFMMSGRLDPRQKGFDILAGAIRLFFRRHSDARFLLTADAGQVGDAWIEDLRHLGAEFPGRVMVCAFRMQHAYPESQAGASFAVWPSLYEPFGGVSEFALKGTPSVGHRTGGLAQQIIDLDCDENDMNSKATGITYATESPPTRKIWQEFMDAPTPEQRARHPLFTSHVEGLATALHRAADIFRTDPDAYAKILSNLLGSMQSYSWERTAAEYRAIYEQAATGEATSEPSVPHDETRAGASIVNRQ